MKITKCFTVMVILLLLSINIAFASPPGKGEITVKSDDAIDRIVVRYNIGSLMGEPIINVAYSFYSYTLIRSDIDPTQVLWVKIKDNLISSNYAWIRVDAIPPSLNGPWSDDFTGSPSWDTVLVNGWSDKQSTKYVDAEMAKQFWRNGFQVVGAQLSTKYDKYISQKPQPVQQPVQQPQQPKPQTQSPGNSSPFAGQWKEGNSLKSLWIKDVGGSLNISGFDGSASNHQVMDVQVTQNSLTFRESYRLAELLINKWYYYSYSYTITRTGDPNVLEVEKVNDKTGKPSSFTITRIK